MVIYVYCLNTDFVESINIINICLILSTFSVLFLWVVVLCNQGPQFTALPEGAIMLLRWPCQQYSMWSKSSLWLAPLYWYVAVWEIWGNLIMVHVWVTLGLSTIQWEWWMWDNESVTKLLCMLWAIWLAKKDQNSINHIIIYSWH